MIERKSFLLYTDIKEVLQDLSNDQKGILFEAILDYELGLEPQLTDPLLKIAFIPIRQNLDINNAKWVEEKRKRSEAGKKGMESRWGNRENPTEKDNNVTDVITDNNKDNNVTNVITEDNNVKPVKTKRFTPPTIDEVKDYCTERNNRVDAQAFMDFYTAKGWMVGKNKMKDWKACVRTWEQRQTDRPTTANTTNINDYLTQRALGGIL